MYIDITAANAPNFLKNYGIARDVADAELARSVDRKIIEWQSDSSGATGLPETFAQKLGFADPWLQGNVALDQNNSPEVGSFRTPEPGRATHFDGLSRVECGNVDFGNLWSTVIWFKAFESAGVQSFFGQYEVPDNRAFRIGLTSSGQITGYCSADGAVAVPIAGANSTPTMPNGLADGNWHCLAVTFDAGDWEFWVDGLLKAEQTTASVTSIFNSNAALRLGLGFNTSNEPFTGELFDFQMFDRVLDKSEIRGIVSQKTQPYTRSVNAPTDATVRYGLNTASNSIVLESGGSNGNQHGILVNGNNATQYVGSDVPYSLPNVLGHSNHLRFDKNNNRGVTVYKPAVTTGLTPNKYEIEFICTPESWDRLGSVNGLSVFAIGFYTPYAVTLLNGEVRFVYKDNTATVQAAIASETAQLGEECHYKILVDRAALLIRFTNLKTGVVTERSMPNMIAASIQGAAFVSGFGVGASSNLTFDGCVDYVKLTNVNTNKTLLELDWRKNGLTSDIDRNVHNDPFVELTKLFGGGELLASSAKAANLEIDSYNGSAIEYDGLCPKSGLLVQSPAAQFDGINDRVLVPFQAALFSSITVAAWIRLDDPTQNYPMVLATEGTSGFELDLQATTLRPEWKLKIGTWAAVVANSSASVIPGEWTHLAATYDNQAGVMELYVNGVLAGSASASKNISVSKNINIGSRSPYTFKGSICDVHFYDVALSESQVKGVYGQGGTEPTAGTLVARYPMSENVGIKINDVSGNERHAQLYNATVNEFWSTTQDAFHYSVKTGCDVVGLFASAGSGSKLLTNATPSETANGCYAFWVSPNASSNTSVILGSAEVQIRTTQTGVRLSYVGIKDYDFTIAGKLPARTWNHCVISISNNDATLYLNGVLSQTVTGTLNPGSASAVQIGAFGGNGFQGNLADIICLHRTVNSQYEVDSIFAGEVPADAAWAYSLANTLIDSTGNTSATSASAFSFVEIPASADSTSLFRSYVSHPSATGLNSIQTKIDPSPNGDAPYLHSSEGAATFDGSSCLQADGGSASYPYVLKNSEDWVVAFWEKSRSFGGAIIGGFSGNAIRRTGAANMRIDMDASPASANLALLTLNGINEYNHLVFRWVNESLDVFVNGQKVPKTWADPIANSDNLFSINQIGRYGPDSGYAYYDGTIRKLLIYQQTLTDSECIGLYTDKFPQDAAGKYLLGSDLLETSGNNNQFVTETGSVNIFNANFGSTTYLGEALFSGGQAVEWDWVWNIDNSFNEGFDISFTMSTLGTTNWGQNVLWGGTQGFQFVMRTDGSLRVYLGGAVAATVTQTGLDDGVRRVIRVVMGQDNAGSTTLQAYVDGEAQTPATVTTPMPAVNTANAIVGVNSGGGNYFNGTLGNFSIKLNGGTEYKFPFERNADSDNGVYSGTWANDQLRPLFRSVDSSNINIGSTRIDPSFLVTTPQLANQIKTKGY